MHLHWRSLSAVHPNHLSRELGCAVDMAISTVRCQQFQRRRQWAGICFTLSTARRRCCKKNPPPALAELSFLDTTPYIFFIVLNRFFPLFYTTLGLFWWTHLAVILVHIYANLIAITVWNLNLDQHVSYWSVKCDYSWNFWQLTRHISYAWQRKRSHGHGIRRPCTRTTYVQSRED